MEKELKVIPIEKGYLYLPECNLLINQELKEIFEIYFKSNKIKFDDVKVDGYFLKKQLKNINKLIIEVTEACNFRCKYCIYNNNYLYEKKFSERSIDFETVRIGLEYIFEFIKDQANKVFNISIYGGEPFLKFNLIKEIVSYSKHLFRDWQLIFGATTNGTLLTDEIIKYLVVEGFNITISLDGPLANHNSKRVYKNGKGTFQKVWNTIERINALDPDYLKKKVSFNIVYSLDQPLIDVFDFFTKNDLINKSITYFNRVAEKNTDYYKRIEVDTIKIRKDYESIFNILQLNHINLSKMSPIEESIYRDYFANRALTLKPKSIFFGTCFFNSRLFLDVKGIFYICENLNNGFPLGDVWNGFNFDKMIEMAKEFKNIKMQYCSNCEINYLCRPCYIVFAANGKLKLNKRFCSRYKKSILGNLKRRIRFEENKIQKNGNINSRVFKFHQFITIVKGTSKTALIDFINGDIYHISTKIVEQFENKEYDQISGFIKAAMDSNLIIKVKERTWIPKLTDSIKEEIEKKSITLCIEDGVDIALLKQQVSNFDISQIIVYGSNSHKMEKLFPDVDIFYEKPDYAKCKSLSIIKKDDFVKIYEEFYNFAQVCNNCWGYKISITKDGMVRPCIYSDIIIDELKNLSTPKIIEKIKNYWYISKDKIEKCKDCELRYTCIDCRENAQRNSNGNLYATNPTCKYNPNTGIWESHEIKEKK